MNPMKKILFILFISLVIAQDSNTDFLKSELNLVIDDINSKKFSSEKKINEVALNLSNV